MQTETPEKLKDWLFQQRNTFERFFATQRQGNAPYISDLIPPDSGLSFLGAEGGRNAYLRKNHCQHSWVAILRFRVADEDREILIPAPQADGVFVINGNQYTAPIQRLWDTKANRVAEYRRFDHVVLDGLKRRIQDEEEPKTPAEHPQSAQEKAFSDLARYLCWVLNPSFQANPEKLLLPLDPSLNKWGMLSRQTQVETLVVDWEKAEENNAPLQCGERRYRQVRESETLEGAARMPEDGLDAFHTPESEKIGLTRYLTLGTTINDDRSLQIENREAVGIMASLVPFAQHDDACRVLMASGMMGRAVQTRAAAIPQSRTSFEHLFRSTFPEVDKGNMGVDLRVGFMFWKGFNFEDAVVVSESAAAKLHTEEWRVVSIPVPCFCTADSKSLGEVTKGESLVTFRYSPVELALRMPVKPTDTVQEAVGLFPLDLEWSGPDTRCPCDGNIEKVETVELWKEADCRSASRYSRRIDFTIRIDRPLEIGDKICNRHGNKGVVSVILPDKEMPRVNNKPLEVLFNPIGVINRGNYGQLLEAWTDRLGGLSPDIVSKPEVRMQAVLAKAGDSRLVSSEVTIPGPGGPSAIKAVVGTNYVLRLPHYASEDFNVCRNTRFSSITEQPPKGVGQKYGEMEIAALQAHGAEEILQELCVERSREPQKGKVQPGPQHPLQEFLRSVGFQLACADTEVQLTKCEEKPYGKNLFDTSIKCDADPDCNAREGGQIRLSTLYRRLCSEPFFDECGGVYLDLGETLCFNLQTGNDKTGKQPSVRYLSILHPRYRPNLSEGGINKTTKCLMQLVHALWKQPSRKDNDEKKTDDDSKKEVQKSCEFLLRNLIGLLKDKHGIVRRVGLCRRLTYSARLVIVPEPSLPVDCVSLPWDAVRVLFKKLLSGSDWARDILSKRQSQINEICHETHKQKIDKLLQSEWVLLNRAPSLHKYNVLAFHPRVHFDSKVMRISPSVTKPFAADFDGDQMSVVPLFSESAKQEAIRLSVPHNLISVADRSVIPALTKDFRFGLFLSGSTRSSLDSLNKELKDKEFPLLPPADDPAEAFDKWVQEWPQPDPGFPAALQIVMKHGLQALDLYQDHSCFGDRGSMCEFLTVLHKSGAAKTGKLLDAEGEDVPLLTGVNLSEIRPRAVKRVNSLIKGKLSLGDFGGLQRRLYYRIRCSESNGLAFKGNMQAALVSIQSLCERATQSALSSKGGSNQLDFDDFVTTIEGMISDQQMPKPEIQELLAFDPDCLSRHMQILANHVLDKRASLSPFLVFLKTPFDEMPETMSSNRLDPRIGVFLA